ncbi:MAG: hypothetical protein Q4C60_08675 [Eubacteriales bacterium]|nr:hypothetical protein [Eubacteriales bacterium]
MKKSNGSCSHFPLLTFTLRRERILSPLWILSLLLFSVLLAVFMDGMFDDASRAALALTLDNPGIIAMMGPVYGAEHYTVGAMYATTMFLWAALAVAVMNLFLIVRYTRADEECGRCDMLDSLPLGRMAGLRAAVLTAVIADGALGLLHALFLALLPIGSMGLRGCLVYGAGLSLNGLVFAGVAAVCCQLFASSGTALSVSIGVLGVSYLLRAVGDLGSGCLSLLSPLGLMQRTQPFVRDEFLPLLILLAEAALLLSFACLLRRVRESGQGVLPPRSGRSRASRFLRSPLTLALRLLKTPLLICLLTMFAFGAAYGSILGDIETFAAQSEFYQALIGVRADYPVAVMFASMVICILSLLGTAPLLAAISQLWNEEKRGRLEAVFCQPPTRVSSLAGRIVIALAASVLLQIASAFGLFLSGSVVLTEPLSLPFLLRASLVYLPAQWITLGLSVFLLGAAPRLLNGVWIYFGCSFFVAFIGRSLDLPEWLSVLTPFSMIPQLPADEISSGVLLAMTLLAAALFTAGTLLYRKRDLA